MMWRLGDFQVLTQLRMSLHLLVRLIMRRFIQVESNLVSSWIVTPQGEKTLVDAGLFLTYTKDQKFGPNSTVTVTGTYDEIFSGTASKEIQYEGFIDSWTKTNGVNGFTIMGLGVGEDDLTRPGVSDRIIDFAEMMGALPGNGKMTKSMLKEFQKVDKDLLPLISKIVDNMKGMTVATKLKDKGDIESDSFQCDVCGGKVFSIDQLEEHAGARDTTISGEKIEENE